MQIWDAAGTASALHDLITHNRLAWQLACAWDDQHSDDTPLVLVCEKLAEDWKKMVWLNRALSLLESIQVLILVVGAAALVASIHCMSWYFIPVMVFFGLSFWVDLCLAKAIRKKIGQYCKLGIQLRDAHGAILQVYDRYKALGDVSDILKFMDALCLLIVKREKLGIYKQKEVLSIGSDDILIAENQDDLKEFFRISVIEVGLFGLTTTDLKVHYAKAHAKWLEMVASGEILTDFQI